MIPKSTRAQRELLARVARMWEQQEGAGSDDLDAAFSVVPKILADLEKAEAALREVTDTY